MDRDLEQTMGAILSDGLQSFAEAAGLSPVGLTDGLTALVEKAEQKAHECYFRRCRVCEKRFCVYETDVIDDGLCSLTCQQEEAGADSPIEYPYGISCHTQGGLPANPRGQR